MSLVSLVVRGVTAPNRCLPLGKACREIILRLER
jgi:hypothetical protein